MNGTKTDRTLPASFRVKIVSESCKFWRKWENIWSFHHLDSLFRGTRLSRFKTLSLPFTRSFFLSAFHFFFHLFIAWCLLTCFSNGSPVFEVSQLNSFNEHVIWVTCVYFDQLLDYITHEILHFKKSNTLGA